MSMSIVLGCCLFSAGACMGVLVQGILSMASYRTDIEEWSHRDFESLN